MAVGGLVTWWLGREGGGGSGPGRPPPAGRGAYPLLSVAQVGLLGGSLGTLATVFWTHLWMGCVLFGGGYVLVALLEPYAVGQFGWVTSAQFLDGVALTQAVPGPISTLSAFVGYAAGGVPGALLATAGIYLPAFVTVLFVAPRLERLREMEAVRLALSGVVAVVAGAVVGVGVSLTAAGIGDPGAAALAVGALVLAVWKKVPSIWLVACGLVAGLARALLA